MGTVIGGYHMARSALAAMARLDVTEGDRSYLSGKIATARFYAEQIMPQVDALLPAIVKGSESVLLLYNEQF